MLHDPVGREIRKPAVRVTVMLIAQHGNGKLCLRWVGGGLGSLRCGITLLIWVKAVTNSWLSTAEFFQVPTRPGDKRS